jgi:hypothetical protein
MKRSGKFEKKHEIETIKIIIDDSTFGCNYLV